MTHFNQAANSWDTPEKIQQNKMYADEIIQCLQGNVPRHILEVGCGTGLLGSNFVNDKTKLLGIDTSSGMLEVFNQKFTNYPLVKSQLINLEKENLNNDEKDFDLIISAMAFHHLENPKDMLKKLKSLSLKAGAIVVIDLDQEDGTFHPDPKNMGVHHFGFSSDETNSWSKELNFSKVIRKTVNVIHKNEKEYPIFMSIFFN
jgi:ubiquinone/menaquinone biosynthesis C-methylase UbiE